MLTPLRSICDAVNAALGSTRQATALTPPPSIFDDDTAVSLLRVKRSCLRHFRGSLVLPRLSRLCASSRRADAISERLRRCQCCLSCVRQAVMLRPAPSSFDDDTVVAAAHVKPSC
ncbi:hypothetical protein OAO87_03120 [bacterium]|nr:hypothetical protein [bacterium]